MTGADRPSLETTSREAATLQANDRTLLAWMRTGISLTTFGFVIARIGAWLRLTGHPGQEVPNSGWIGALFVLLGAIVEGIGIARYVLFHRAFLRREPVPTGVTSVLTMAVAVCGLAALLGAFVVLSLHP